MLKVLSKTDKTMAPLIIRVALGLVMLVHGTQKAFGWFGGPGFLKTFEGFTRDAGFYPWVPSFVMITELFGAFFLIIGFLTRISALCTGTMLFACAYLYHIDNGFFMNWTGKAHGEGVEYHVLGIAMAVALIVQGGGFLSVDSAMAKREKKFFI
ncbi:MAG: DoxX family protein [Nitrospirae bacterium]|nr:DoxX family protein [Nitrospirota bacterium]